MSNLTDLNAEIGASIIGDDAEPTLTLKNTSTGPGLKADRLLVTGAATIAGQTNFAGSLTGNLTIASNATEGLPLSLVKSGAIGSPSVALIAYQVSGASVPVFELKSNALVSAVSIVFAASANWAGLALIRVKYSDGTTYGWIPVLPPGVVTAAAI